MYYYVLSGKMQKYADGPQNNLSTPWHWRVMTNDVPNSFKSNIKKSNVNSHDQE